ncbi:MAG TPA: hypothetical protein VFJ16_01225 [Longimicrobium sp.]|nr:hypothetical protein [Longimicrobium sp.]
MDVDVNIRRTLVSLAAVALVLAGCTEASQAPLAPAAPARLLSGGIDVSGLLQFVGAPSLSGTRHAEKYIVASQGGFVELNGFRVDIPAGALPYSTTVTIDLPSDPLLAKRVMAEFGPHGIQFNQPVTLSFPLTNVLLSGGPFEVARWENGQWVGLGGWVSGDGTRLYGTTPHFSAYGGKYIMAGG